MPSPALRLRNPGDLLATIPFVLGFHPSASLVLICLHGGRVGLLGRIDLPGPGLLDGAVSALLRAVTTDHPDAALLIGYERVDGQSVSALDAVAQELSRLGVDVKDRLVVRDGRWRSLDCHDPACCPPGGTPIPAAVDKAGLTAEFVGHEICPHPDRASLAAQLEPGPGAARVEELLRSHDAGPRRVGTEQNLSASFDAWARVLDVTDGAPSITADDAARAAVSLQDVPLRDALIGWLTPGTLARSTFGADVQELLSRLDEGRDGRRDDSGSGVAQNRLQGRLVAVCAMLPDSAAAPALTVLAAFAWWRGDGALTRVALERAVRADPAYRLALLLEQMLDLGIRPTPA